MSRNLSVSVEDVGMSAGRPPSSVKNATASPQGMSVDTCARVRASRGRVSLALQDGENPSSGVALQRAKRSNRAKYISRAFKTAVQHAMELRRVKQGSNERLAELEREKSRVVARAVVLAALVACILTTVVLITATVTYTVIAGPGSVCALLADGPWQRWKHDFGRGYNTTSEEQTANSRFHETERYIQYINELNADCGPHGVVLAPNAFSAESPSEFLGAAPRNSFGDGDGLQTAPCRVHTSRSCAVPVRRQLQADDDAGGVSRARRSTSLAKNWWLDGDVFRSTADSGAGCRNAAAAAAVAAVESAYLINNGVRATQGLSLRGSIDEVKKCLLPHIPGAQCVSPVVVLDWISCIGGLQTASSFRSGASGTCSSQSAYCARVDPSLYSPAVRRLLDESNGNSARALSEPVDAPSGHSGGSRGGVQCGTDGQSRRLAVDSIMTVAQPPTCDSPCGAECSVECEAAFQVCYDTHGNVTNRYGICRDDFLDAGRLCFAFCEPYCSDTQQMAALRAKESGGLASCCRRALEMAESNISHAVCAIPNALRGGRSLPRALSRFCGDALHRNLGHSTQALSRRPDLSHVLRRLCACRRQLSNASGTGIGNVVIAGLTISGAMPWWQSYRGGVVVRNCPFDGSKASLDTSGLIVGMNSTPGVDGVSEGSVPYWIVQMFRGPGWGDQGFVYIERGRNLCGIETSAITVQVWDHDSDSFCQLPLDDPCFDASQLDPVNGTGAHFYDSQKCPLFLSPTGSLVSRDGSTPPSAAAILPAAAGGVAFHWTMM